LSLCHWFFFTENDLKVALLQVYDDFLFDGDG